MLSYIDIGLEIGFRYPAANYTGVLKRLETRRLLIRSIRDTQLEPIAAVVIESNPLLRRGQILVTGIDLDKCQERSFYYDSMEDVVFDPKDVSQLHRVYVFDPSGETGPIMAFAHAEQAQAVLWASEWESDNQGHSAVVWPIGAKPPLRARNL